ncbi:MFS transporter [Myxococcota bacterium]|nr:MFS transporter [Myxococcota bacterium]
MTTSAIVRAARSRCALSTPARPPPHPVVWSVLYLPFGALGGFVTVALTFLATRHGLSITEGALLGAASLISQWLKWSWAPVVDVTLTPKRWYAIATSLSALGVLLMSTIPLGPETLWLLLAIVAVASLVNSIVGMAIEAIMAAVTPPDQVGRVSAWFQAGNLGGAGFGGGLGLLMLQHLPAPWMAGAIMGVLFMACNLALAFVSGGGSHHAAKTPWQALRGVFGDVRSLAKSKGGLAAAVICFMPVGTGAAQGVLTQAAVAARWGAGEREVALLQGFGAGLLTILGAFAGGWLSDRVHPRIAYVICGLGIGAVTVGMALTPPSVGAYVAWQMAYSFGVGTAYAAFTAVVLNAIGAASAATKYNLYASLSNFPIWWLGLLLGRVADTAGPVAMLLTEAGLGVVGVAIFFSALALIRRSRLPEEAPAAA